MTPETNFTFIINGYSTIALAAAIFLSLLAIVWKGKKEIHDTITEALKEIKKEVKELGDKFFSHDKEIHVLQKQYGEAHSPMRPNEKGSALLEQSGFNEIYPEIRQRLFEIMDKEGTPTLYDAEKNAREALEDLRRDPVINPLKNHAVNNPDESLELIFSVAAWVIRDDYWRERNK